MLVDLKSILKATAASYGASFYEVPMQISDVHQILPVSWNNPDTLRAIQTISKHMEDNVLVGLEDTSGLCYAAFRLKDQISTFCICGPWTMHSPKAVMDPTLPEDPKRYAYSAQQDSQNLLHVCLVQKPAPASQCATVRKRQKKLRQKEITQKATFIIILPRIRKRKWIIQPVSAIYRCWQEC